MEILIWIMLAMLVIAFVLSIVALWLAIKISRDLDGFMCELAEYVDEDFSEMEMYEHEVFVN